MSRWSYFCGLMLWRIATLETVHMCPYEKLYIAATLEENDVCARCFHGSFLKLSKNKP